MVNSKTFDLTVNAFQDFVNEVFSGTDESQKAKLRTKLNQFSKISNDERKRMPDDQINIILPPEMLEKILKMLNFKDICRGNLVCRRWNEIIVKGNLVKKVAGKMLVMGGTPFYRKHRTDSNIIFRTLNGHKCVNHLRVELRTDIERTWNISSYLKRETFLLFIDFSNSNIILIKFQLIFPYN